MRKKNGRENCSIRDDGNISTLIDFIVRSLLEITMLYHLSKNIDELLLILGRRIYGRGIARETLTSNISIDSQN